MIAVIDYGVGNLFSLKSSLYSIGQEAVVNRDQEELDRADHILGMQLLFETSFEYGEHQGLGLISGQVRDIGTVLPSGLAIPHMGWNALHFPGERPRSPIFRALEEGTHVYFVHSFAGFDCKGQCTATTEYGAELTAAVQNGNVYGTQFHPEKSGAVGLTILKAFCELE